MNMTRLTIAVVLATAAMAALAQGADASHAAHHDAQAGAPNAGMTQAEVRRIDRGNRKLTLRHGEIPSLDMPPMTMVFQVRDAAMLDGLKAGDAVRFRAEKIGGTYTVTAIEAAR